jgi:uncharacterized protein (UPF0210 family)
LFVSIYEEIESALQMCLPIISLMQWRTARKQALSSNEKHKEPNHNNDNKSVGVLKLLQFDSAHLLSPFIHQPLHRITLRLTFINEPSF